MMNNISKKELIISVVVLVISGIVFFCLDSNDEEYYDNFEKKEFHGTIKTIEILDRGFLNVYFLTGEKVYLGQWFNSNNCQLQVLDSIAKEYGSIKIKVYRNESLIYTELNEYYERRFSK